MKNEDNKNLLDTIVDAVNIVVNKETGLPIGFDMSNIKDEDLLNNKEYLKTIAYLNAYQIKFRQLKRYLEIIKKRGKKEEAEKRVREKMDALEAKIKVLTLQKKKYEKENF